MCLSIPGKIIKINKNKATISYGGIEKEADCSLIKCKVNDYVIVQAGFVMLKVPKEEALKSLEEWKKVK